MWRRLRGLKISLTLLVGIAWVLPCGAQQLQDAEDTRLAQTTIPHPRSYPFPPNQAGMPTYDGANRRFTTKQLELMNKERQKSMVADTNKLLKLAAELNAEVNGDHAGEFSDDQLRKVDEIEKLARKVRNEMSFWMGSGPIMGPLLPAAQFP